MSSTTYGAIASPSSSGNMNDIITTGLIIFGITACAVVSSVTLFQVNSLHSLPRSSKINNPEAVDDNFFPSASTSTTIDSPSSSTGDPPNILIAYHSRSGGTRQLANFTAGGVLQYPNATVIQIDVEEILDWNATETVTLLNSADGIILGSGVYNGDVHSIMNQWLQSWPLELDLSWTVTNTFCTSGGYATGAQPTLYSMIRALQTFSAIYAGGTQWRSGNGVCAIVEGSDGASGMQNVEEVAKLAQYAGYRVAMLSSQMKAAKKAVRMSNADPFDYANPDRLKVNWPLRELDS